MKKKIKSKLGKHNLPKVVKSKKEHDDFLNFPLDHYSYSSMVQFTSNPILFKIKYVNRDRYDTTTNISGVIGQAFHSAMEVYHGGNPDMKPRDHAEAIEFGLKTGMDFLDKYEDGFISFSKTVPTKQKAQELFAFAYNSYIKEMNEQDEIVALEDEINEQIDIEWRGRKLDLPVKLKGYLDKVVKTKDGKLKIKDYKTCRSFSDPEKIDGSKIIQAIVYYMLAYAKYGIEPYSMTYEEIKLSKDESGKQIRQYEIVYSENELYFDFFFRLYEDITNAINGKMVYVPNVQTLFDNEVAIISYIHHLDTTEEKAKEMKKLKVDNITDLLKKKIQSAGNMRKFMKTIEQQFCSAKSLNYNRMENHQKITTKMMEYGMMLQFEDKIEGAAVDMYRFTPSVGLKMSRLKGFVADIEQVMGKSGIRVLTPIPNTTLVGFEVPKDSRTFPMIPKNNGYEFAIGQTIFGENRYYDIRTAPHVLVAGSSGSGKSIFLHSIVKQIRNTESDLVIIDPKMVEFPGAYNEKEEIASKLKSLVDLMEERYSQLAKSGHRNAMAAGIKPLFLVIDEYADLVMMSEKRKKSSVVTETKKKGVKVTTRDTDEGEPTIQEYIQRLAQKGRACGIHIVLATQRASTKIISGDIKVNFVVKAIFKMSKAVDSQIMIDEPGAEKLLGKGDMLFYDGESLERLQGFMV